MDEIKAKQQVVEKIKSSAKILVTVSDNPSVDALSAALALTLLLDKQEKYATAIFSGEVPPAIAFLEPEKTFDDTTDSLRDFIIALNKEKADHLRYKVEGDSVKIFITPYKTTIDQSDLDFSQGDYNVELVIALGVDNQESLDKELDDHGKILHDATIITMTAGDQSSNLGGIDWHDANASSLSEMVTGLAEALKTDKKKSLLDGPIATALLTGIVAETDRFSNERTTSKAMTVAASLMSAGADQQLIANELQASQEISSSQTSSDASDSVATVDTSTDDGTLTINQHDDPTSLNISHEGETLADLDKRVLGHKKAKEKVVEEVEATQEAHAEEEAREEALEAARQEKNNQPEPEPVPEPTPEPTPASEPEPTPVPETQSDPEPSVMQAQSDPVLAYEPSSGPAVGSAYSLEGDLEEPMLGGTLNATTEQAADDTRREIEADQNKTILTHAYLGDPSTPEQQEGDTQGSPGSPPPAPGSVGVNDFSASESLHSAYSSGGSLNTTSGAQRVIQPLSEAPAEPAGGYAPSVPSATPSELGLPMPPPIPDFSQQGAITPPSPPAEQPAILGDIFAPESASAPAPVDVTANAVADPNTAYAPEPLPPVITELASAPTNTDDPGQFQIPSR